MVQSASVEALLTLNAQGFDEGIETAIKSVDKLVSNITTSDKTLKTFENNIEALENCLINLANATNVLNGFEKSITTFNSLANAMDKLVKSAQLFEQNGGVTVELFEQMGISARQFMEALSGASIQLTNVVQSTKLLTTSNGELVASEENEISTTERVRREFGLMYAELCNMAIGLRKTDGALQSTSSAMYSSTSGIQKVNTTLNQTHGQVTTTTTDLSKFKGELTSTQSPINTTSSNIERLKYTWNGLSREFQETYAELMRMALGIEEFNSLSNKSNSTVQKQVNNFERFRAELTQTTGSIRQVGYASSQSTSAMEKQAVATKDLTSAMSSLKMMVTMVGSMFAWNFAHNLYVATSETIKARSEMYSMFETMGMTKSQIGDFNQALDQTAQKFQRINKYMIGETVSSIGVEFQLSTAEMKKALDVTSIITSEYLRAGRNTSEASLAVKDIMQGEFQRLSRETGVKSEQLKEAGWSGDKTDVMSLLNALEKVALSRNWDVFATKANSLSDIVQITQNRISEAIADISERYVPLITGAFNILANAVQIVASAFMGIFDWLDGDGWVQTATDIGLVTTALLVGFGALTSYRTGASLVQIVQMGLRGSIMATVFALDAETVAQHGSLNALGAKLTGLTAENIGEMTLSRAIATRVLGLEAETVAQIGVKGAIMSSVYARELEKIEAMGTDTATKSLLVTRLQERIANLRGTSVILARILGLEAETLAEGSLMGAIGRKVLAQLSEIGVVSEATVAEASHTAVVVAGTLAITTMVAVIGLLIAGFMALIAPILNSASAMEKFNKLVKEGNNLIKDAKSTRDKFAKQYEEASKRLSTLTKGTKEYNTVLMEQAQAQKNMNYMTEQYIPKLQEATTLAQRAQEKYDDGKVKSMVNAERELNEEFIKLGINSQLAGEMASSAMAEAREGQRILYTALQRFNYDLSKHNKGTIALTATLKRSGKEDKEIEEVIDGYNTAWKNMEKNRQVRLTSDNFGDIINASLGEAYFSAVLWWTEFNGYLEAGAGNIAWDKFWKGLAHGFADLPLLHDFWGWVFKESGMLEYKGKGWEGLGQFFTDSLKKTILGLPIHIGDWIIKLFTGQGEPYDFSQIVNLIVESLVNSLYNFNPIGVGFNFAFWIEKLLGLSNGEAIDFSSLSLTGFNLTEWFKQQIGVSSDKGIFDEEFQSAVMNKIVQLAEQIRQGFVNEISQGFNNVISYTKTLLVNWMNVGIEGAVNLLNGIVSVVSMISPKVGAEFAKIPSRIREAIPSAINVAISYGKSIIDAVLGAMGIHSPGIIQNKVTAEFENTISNIQGTVDSANNIGQEFGDAITSGVTDNLTGGFIVDYRGDASQINSINSAISSDTATTFSELGTTVDGTINMMASNVATNYTNMNTLQSSMLNGMVSQNKTSFTNIQTQTNNSLKNMRDSTSNVTIQMTKAWSTMKDNIVASANQLKTQSTAHFNTLSSHIGTFYRKLQNPSMWGAGDQVPTRYYNSARGNRGRTAVRRHFGLGGTGFAGGVGQANLPKTMSLKKLRQMMGDSPIFNGLDLNQIVDVATFLSNFDGGFGWNTWHSKHFSKIKTTTGDYNMKSPQIMHRINTNANFHPKEFYNGKPNVSFGQFQSIAESLFSAIPYDFYYNSDKYGSWVNALQAGACNCWDGANALIALASTFGFGGYMASGTWNGIPHVYAVINGRKMDTTGWQQRRNWNGVSAGGDVKGVGQTTVNVTVDLSNSVVYGVDDLDSRIENGVDKAMQKTINPSKIVGY